MAYRKPTALTRKVFNPIAMKLGLRGVSTLAVPKRRTGELEQVPVIPIEVDGARYVVSPRGETDWVRNLRAARGGRLSRRGLSQHFDTVEMPAADRPPIIAAYRAKAGRAVKAHFEQLPDPADHPVFRVDVLPQEGAES